MKDLLFIKRVVRWLKWCALSGLLLCLVTGAAMCIHLGRAPRITVVNDSGQMVADVKISGHGFEHRIPVLQPGAKQIFVASVHGESGISVACKVGSRPLSVINQGHIETHGGYQATVTIIDTIQVQSGR